MEKSVSTKIFDATKYIAPAIAITMIIIARLDVPENEVVYWQSAVYWIVNSSLIILKPILLKAFDKIDKWLSR